MPRRGLSIWRIFALILTTGTFKVGAVEELTCAYKPTDKHDPDAQGTPGRPIIINRLENDEAEMGIILADNKSIRCAHAPNYCFTVWRVEHTEDGKQYNDIMTQGCWENQSPNDCSQDVCSPTAKPFINGTFFCCCNGDMCNSNFTTELALQPTTTVSGYKYEVDPNYKQRTVIIALASVMSVAVVTVLTYLTIRLCCQGDKETPSLDSAHLVETPPSPSYELDSLKLGKLVHNSRFGEIWKGTLNDIQVAVKVFSSSQRQYYLSERDIYSLPYMDSSALPHFYGSEERLTVDGLTQYVIVMSYVTHGSLTSYLKNNTVDWANMCKMCHSVSSGLGHLHTDIWKGDRVKPAVAHRDLNSRNILVRDDLTCMLCDFGFAMKISGSHFIRNGQEENAEHASLSDVGTVRYMAPEVLEGAVNLRDCEASLKQIDVYALGLVFWEIGSRCTDLYQGMPVPEYKLPFQEEVGMHPSFEDMQQLVCKNKHRPIFPDTWKDTNQAIHAFKETIEDCWDHDAEARLTSLCVEERVLEMAALWDNRHKGMTPTILTSGFLGELEDKATVQRNPTMYQSSHISHPTTEVISPPPNASITMAVRPPGQRGSSNGDSMSSRVSVPVPNRLSRSELSSGSTVETIMSPSDPGIPIVTETVLNKTNLNQANAKANRALQPHQGQNPTVARNTHKRSDEELAIVGNTLVDKSVMKSGGMKAGDKARGLSNVALADELLDVLADNLESSLVQNDMLNQQQQHQHHHQHQHQHQSHSAPIPYLQNHVQSNVVRPKQPNVPGNGSAYPATVPTAKRGISNNNIKLKKNKNETKAAGFMRSLFGRGGLLSKGRSQSSDRAAAQPLTMDNTREVAPLNYPRPSKSNLDAALPAVSSEVRLVNGQPTVRPTTLPFTDHEPTPNYNLDLAAQNTRLGMAEVGVAKLEDNPTGQPAMVQVRNKSLSSVELSPNGGWSSNFVDSDTDSESRARRPCSLSLTGHNYTSASLGNLAKGPLERLRGGGGGGAAGGASSKGPRRDAAAPLELLEQNHNTINNPGASSSNVDVNLCGDGGRGSGDGGRGGGRRGQHQAPISLQQFGSAELRVHQPQAPADCRC